MPRRPKKKRRNCVECDEPAVRQHRSLWYCYECYEAAVEEDNYRESYHKGYDGYDNEDD